MFTAPGRALLAQVLNEHRGLVLLPAAGKAFCRLVARGVLFSHRILRNACHFRDTLPGNGTLSVHHPAGHRSTRLPSPAAEAEPILREAQKTQEGNLKIGRTRSKNELEEAVEDAKL